METEMNHCNNGATATATATVTAAAIAVVGNGVMNMSNGNGNCNCNGSPVAAAAAIGAGAPAKGEAALLLIERLTESAEKVQAELLLIEGLTESAEKVQAELLRDVLTKNAGTEYLSQYLHGRTDHASFKRLVPVVNYEDIKPYIQRIANGDKSPVISAEPISELLTSSGTSGGQPKIMPSTRQELDKKTLLYNLLMPIMNQYVAGLDKGKGMYLLFVKAETTTAGGLKARPVLTSYYKSDNFRKRPYDRFNVHTSPDETILCGDGRQSMFMQLLCGLLQRNEVLRVGAIFASALIRAIKFLEENWRELCHNIRHGRLSDWIDDAPARAAVSALLESPDPALAEEIEAVCEAPSWQGIIRRIWPQTIYVDVIVTGSMAQYIPQLDFYSGGLPLVCTMYASSECYFGVNLRPLSKPSQVSYTLLPNMCYFEFLQVSTEDVHGNSSHAEDATVDGEALVDLVDVQLGQYYELVVTTCAGLYRYRVGDILLVTGFHNKAPQFQFVYRRNVVLSVDTDKTNEEDLLKAVTTAKKLLEPYKVMLSEYTSYADTSTIPGHYVLFWELSTTKETILPTVDASVLENCCSAIEESLDSVYRRCRSKDKSIGPLEIRVVEPGTFDSLMDYCISHGSSYNQYKTPRCIKSSQALALLNSKVSASCFSQTTPSWKPYTVHSPVANGHCATSENY